MATVIGLTAARGEEIANEHIETAAVESGNLVLTRRNAEEISVPLPAGGGGFLGGKSFDGSALAYGTESAGTLMTVTSWVAWDTHSGGPAGTSDTANFPDVSVLDPGSTSARMTVGEDGWYMANLHAYIEFPNSAPEHIVCLFDDWGPWMGRGFKQIHPVVPSGYFDTGRHASIDVTSAPFWWEVGDGLRPQLWWPTLDQAPSGNYFPGPIPALNFTVYKLS